MSDNNPDLFGDTLILETRAPLAWEPLQSMPLDEELLQMTRANEELLQTIAMLEESVREGADGTSPQDHALVRLEQKLNVLMAMVNQLIARQVALPPKVLAKLNAHALCWHEPLNPPAVEQHVQVSLYLHGSLPQAVHFVGQVRRIEESEHGRVVCMALLPCGDAMANALEKYIFRHHRRAIAQARPG